MNFLQNFEKRDEIYMNLGSKKAHLDLQELSPVEYYKKYFWFLPREIIDNMDLICRDVYNNKI